ncbi:MAG: hypothetical protein HS104_02620 [Polyangiaceae bacterium]|nr:hypothetical protein [Polyangiaceae bacterium]MBK8996999.1 hypothetical protein [Myxococcales bacterium]MCE7894597.1 hypothetical protein [Sorangiineae bacterium PRO1]
MPPPTPQELKKLLLSEGLEIYRTLVDRVMLADRVRDNLIMDSGVSVLSQDGSLGIRVVFRAQACDFQGESPEGLFGHARRLGQPGQLRGYTEASTTVVPIHDPGDKTRVLDTWYEVAYERAIGDAAELMPELRVALEWPKVATRGGT